MFEKVVARRLEKQKVRDDSINAAAKNAGYQKIRSREARKMLKKSNLMKKARNNSGRFGI